MHGAPHGGAMTTAGPEHTSKGEETRGARQGERDQRKAAGWVGVRVKKKNKAVRGKKKGKRAKGKKKEAVRPGSKGKVRYEWESLSSIRMSKKLQYFSLGCVLCCSLCVIVFLAIRLVNDFINRMNMEE